jgi:hypothetical protein
MKQDKTGGEATGASSHRAFRRGWGQRAARAALAKPLPAALLLMLFIVVCLFNSIRSTLVICLAVPLAISV